MERMDPQAIELSHDEIKRYSRHLIMPEVGLAGQKKLKAASVLLIGTGGLGSPLGMYLAAAGIGKIGLVDYDVVDYTNLQRQIVHGTGNVGQLKVESAKARLLDINPDVEVVTYNEPFTSENALDIARPYDVIVDGTDNFPTRYLTNDVCVLLGKPNVYGSIFRFEGQASVFYAKEGPCYRCLFPEPPPPGLVPSCAEAGVLGVVPGVVGALMAGEVVKLLLGIGEPALGRLLVFDALRLRFRELRLAKNPDCPICGAAPRLTELAEYAAACNQEDEDMTGEDGIEGEVPFDVDVQQLKAWLDKGRDLVLIDVREPHEHQICRIDGSLLVPLAELPRRWQELDSDALVVVHCHHGPRSSHAVQFLRRQGFARATNLAGGIEAWSLYVDPDVPRY
jgi:adenylyltransferase/sulfurtransferase